MKKKFTWKHTLTLLMLIGLFICLGIGFYVLSGNMYFFDGTKINGYDVSEKMLTEVVELIAEKYNERDVSIVEEGAVVYQGQLSEMGYLVHEEKLQEKLRETMDEQKKFLLPFFASKELEIEIPFRFDEELFGEVMTADSLDGERIESQDAKLVLDGEKYRIEEEVYGTQFDEERLQAEIKEQLDEILNVSDVLEIHLSDDVYVVPQIKSDNEQLHYEMDAYNKYCQAKITYVFGSENEVLNWETIQDWILVDKTNSEINEEAVIAYVDELRKKYNTIYLDRFFVNSYGEEIKLPSNDYGYRINRELEIQQLLTDIKANTATEREPIYSHKGYQRKGQDDVVGCYIEVDLTNQRLWLYKDYKLVVESDIVTGKPSYQETTTGAFPIAYKVSPFTLTGATWKQYVTYWMPFHDGQGLHDATWKSEFGGEIYLTNGSHGCVNLPFKVAEKIYENIEARYPIFLYK